MQALENRIPPPLVATLFALFMWALSSVVPGIEVSDSLRLATTLAVLLLGAFFCLAGVLSFRRARTPVHPLQPETASALDRGERLAAPSHHASRAAAWRVLLPGGCAVVPPGQDHGQPAETGDGIGAGEFGDLSGFTQPDVPWLCAVSRCLGGVSRIALGSGWGVGVHPLYEPLADRRGGACA